MGTQAQAIDDFKEEVLDAMSGVAKAITGLAEEVHRVKPTITLPATPAQPAPVVNAPVTVQPAEVVIDRPRAWTFAVEKFNAAGKLISTMKIKATAP